MTLLTVPEHRLPGGSWVVKSGVIKWVIIIATLLITLLITTHEPPGRPWFFP